MKYILVAGPCTDAGPTTCLDGLECVATECKVSCKHFFS